MDENKILARFGIGKKFAYGLFIQSILVIISAIFSINTLQWCILNNGFNIDYISSVVSFLTCISLIIYSFYEFNKDEQYFFTIAIILYIFNQVLCLSNYCLNYVNYYDFIAIIITILQLLLCVYFIYSFNKNFNGAKYAIILMLILEIIGEAMWCSIGAWPWYGPIPYIVIIVSIGLTYIERVQRGKYSKLK